MLRLDPTKFKRDLTAHSVSFFALDQTVTVDDAMIDALIIESQAACNRPARICLHTMTIHRRYIHQIPEPELIRKPA